MKIFISFIFLFSSVLHAAVLYIGDSHSVVRSLTIEEDKRRFGNVFYDALVAQGHQVNFYAACGSSAEDWARGDSTTCGYTSIVDGKFTYSVEANFPALAKVYAPAKHSQVIVNLGDNMFDWKQNNGKREANFSQSMLNVNINAFFAKLPAMTSEQCTWIGPTYHVEGTNYRKSNAAVDQLYRSLGKLLADKCRLIDSRTLVIAREPNDGLHHSFADGQLWATGVLKLLDL